ncbi:Hypothetical_protein [Hexamita inflata]|uniref:Hypothetical_protein n=1 Tax=Hexamita inflata TaxID=28002 RepID=A0ABP1H8K9_9EUKA
MQVQISESCAKLILNDTLQSLVYNDGSFYSGGVFNGIYSGNGFFMTENGSKIQGEFAKGQFQNKLINIQRKYNEEFGQLVNVKREIEKDNIVEELKKKEEMKCKSYGKEDKKGNNNGQEKDKNDEQANNKEKDNKQKNKKQDEEKHEYNFQNKNIKNQNQNKIIEIGNQRIQYVNGIIQKDNKQTHKDEANVQITPQFITINNKERNTMLFSDGSVYSGQLVNNLFHGKGVLVVDQKIKFIGEFEYGRFNKTKIQEQLTHKQILIQNVLFTDIKKQQFNIQVPQIIQRENYCQQNDQIMKYEQEPIKANLKYTIEDQKVQIQNINHANLKLIQENEKLTLSVHKNSELCHNIRQNVNELQKQRDNATVQCKEYEQKLEEMLENEKWYNTTIEQLIEEHEKLKENNLQLNTEKKKCEETCKENEQNYKNLKELQENYQKLQNDFQNKNDQIYQQYIIQLKQHEEHEKLKETNLQLNIQKEKQKATVNELELKCQNLENTATKQKENFQNLQTDVQNKNGQIQKQDLELNNLKKSMQETSQNLTNEYEIKLKHQQYNYENTIQLLQQHLNDKLNIQQTAEQYVIQVQNEAKQWIANEQNRLTQEFNIKEQSLLNQYNNQKEHDRQNLQKDHNAEKQALEIETTKHTSELKRQIAALENQLKQQQQQIYVTNTSSQLQTEVQENDTERKIKQKDQTEILISLKDYPQETRSKLIKTLKKQLPQIISAEVTEDQNVMVSVKQVDADETAKTIQRFKIEGKRLTCEIQQSEQSEPEIQISISDSSNK